MKQYTFQVPAEIPSQRIDRYLTAQLQNEFSRTQIQRWIKSGHVLCNGKSVAAHVQIRPGDLLVLEAETPLFLEGIEPENVPLDILYEDEAFLVINKPAGLVVHPGAGHSGGTLVHGLLHHTRQLSQEAGPLKPGIVHRLDKDTSGVMVIAKTDAAHRALSKQFSDRTVRRTYVALVHGQVVRNSGSIQGTLRRHPRDRQRFAVDPEGRGREAITHYRVIRRLKNMTYLELHPETGRTHQLRVHLHHLGHPIVGDPRYGPKNKLEPTLSRQALHAWKLGFVHPITGENMEFTAPVPAELKLFLEP